MPKMFLRLSKCGILCPLKIATRVSACKPALAVAIFFSKFFSKDPADSRNRFGHFRDLIRCSAAFAVALCFFSSAAFANNLAITNVSLREKNTTTHTLAIKFDIYWENSWRDATNYDAVWTFAKYCTANCGTTGTWSHATMYPAGSTPGSASGTLQASPADDGHGFYFNRSTTASGTMTSTGAKILWSYAQDGVSDATASSPNTKVRVFGIEMVYVPVSNFYAGDNGSSASSFKNGAADGTPWYIPSEGAIQMSTGGAYYYTTAGGSGEDGTGSTNTIPAAFPKGYGYNGGMAGFFVMKYELSQGQYRDFLNTLTTAQKAMRTATMTAGKYVMSNTGAPSYRNGLYTSDGSTIVCLLSGAGGGNGASDGEWVAMNYLSWMDLCAYADWAALRPMTELEYEKTARGPSAPASSAYPWGSTDLTQVTSISSGGTNAEVAGNSNNGLCDYGSHASVQGPLRTGFAATGATTRLQSGAGYWGNMELGGNVGELVVTVGQGSGRLYQGTHGDGLLTTTTSYEGNATNTDWPGIDTTTARGVTGAAGSGYRGGSWSGAATQVRTSDRSLNTFATLTRQSYLGGRLVKTDNNTA